MNRYFLGGMTSEGFKTDFNETIYSEDKFTYILKGGPGTGKSTIMKKVVETFSDTDDIDLYYCSSDEKSLDAVVLNKKGIIVVDGTSPHTFDPIYPGIKQTIIHLGDFWNADALKKNEEDIILTTKENSEWHKRCRRYITALSSINSDIYSIGLSALNKNKLSGFIERFVKKNIPDKKSTTGKVSFKKYSVMTQNGYISQEISYKNKFFLCDGLFAGSDFMLRKLEKCISDRGYDIIVSKCELCNNVLYEHIAIPELDIALISSTPLNKTEPNATKINFSRFYFHNKISEKKERLNFSKKALSNMADEAAECMKKAKEIHDELEKFYVSAIDFEKINKLTDKLIKEIKKR
ncbi:MAG: ATPase [Oscillospiraceae bacterium]|nr:ATPase [Oscillospiraceae bacterium]